MVPPSAGKELSPRSPTAAGGHTGLALWASVWKHLLKLKVCLCHGAEFLSLVSAQWKCLHMCTKDMARMFCSSQCPKWDMLGKYRLPQITVHSPTGYHALDCAPSQSAFWHARVLLNSPCAFRPLPICQHVYDSFYGRFHPSFLN